MPGESLEDALAWNLGRYTLHGEIASGGMATVHIGRLQGTAGFSKMVAIKRLHAQFAKDPDFVAMFLDEARLAARVHHPNVVQPLDVIATDGEVFLVMEYIRGESLSKLARVLRPSGKRMPLKIAGAVMVGVLHGLHAAHEATDERGQQLGIVHRDVSPQNVIVGTDGIARVLDFGIAKAADRAYMTREGDLKGKLAYMAPEQLTAESEVDRRADIYAASIVLWELLTGLRLFDADYTSAILARAKDMPTKAPSTVVADLPQALDEVVLKGLARKPSDRFTTAREMAIQLEMVMPLATPSKVGEWIEEVARETLTKRAGRIAEIELLKPPMTASEQAKDVLEELAIDQRTKADARAKTNAEATRSWKATDAKGSREERSMSRADSSPMVPTGSIYVVEPEDIPFALPPPRRPSDHGPLTPQGPLPPPNPPPHTARPLHSRPPPQSMRPEPPSDRVPQRTPPSIHGSAPPPPDVPGLGPSTQPMALPAPLPRASAFPPGVRPPTASARPDFDSFNARANNPRSTQLSPSGAPPALSSGSVGTVNERPSVRAPETAGPNEVAALPRQLLPPTVAQFELPPIRPHVPFELPGGGGIVDLSGGKTRKKSSGSLTAVLLLLVSAAGIFVLLLPMIVKRGYIQAAAQRGIAVAIDDVDLSPRRIRLRGVTATAPDLPGVYVRAAEIGLNVRDGKPEVMDVSGVDITVDGPYPNVRDALNRYLAAHPLRDGGTAKVGGLQKIDVKNAHITWARLFGDTSKVEFDEVSGTLERVEDRSLGEDFQFLSNRITVGTPTGDIGPWRATLTHSRAGNIGKMVLGPGNADPATAAITDLEGSGLVVDVKVPRSTTEKLGVSKTVAGLAIGETLQVEGTLHYARSATSKVEAQSAFALYGLKLAGAQTPVDLRFQARIDGDGSAPLEVLDGVMVLGTFKARIYGKLTVLRDAMRFDVTWKTTARPCTQAMQPDLGANIPALAWDPGALDKTVNVPPTAGQTQVSGTFVLDSRDLAQTRFNAVASNKCGLKIFGP